MILILIALIGLLVGGLIIFNLACDSGSTWFEIIGGVIGTVSMCVAVIGFLIYSVAAYSWIASEHKARIINAEYGTNYTQQDVFYASSVIDTIREIDRKRFEINGDIGKSINSKTEQK